jgi:hypothetical protein
MPRTCSMLQGLMNACMHQVLLGGLLLQGPSQGALAGCSEGKLAKALLRRFDDPSAACRELAVTCLKDLLEASGFERVLQELQLLETSWGTGANLCPNHVAGISRVRLDADALHDAGAGGAARG